MGQRSTDTSRACFALVVKQDFGGVRPAWSATSRGRGCRTTPGGHPGDRRGRGRPLRQGDGCWLATVRHPRRGRPATTVGGRAGRGTAATMTPPHDRVGGSGATSSWLVGHSPRLDPGPSYRTCEHVLAGDEQRVTRLRDWGIFRKNGAGAATPATQGEIAPSGGSSSGADPPNVAPPISRSSPHLATFGRDLSRLESLSMEL